MLRTNSLLDKAVLFTNNFMDVLDEVLLRFWNSLNNHSVKYIMVGGFATRFHGFNRSTDDLDIWLYDILDNRKNLSAAFNELDYGDFPSFETMEFVPRNITE